MFRYRQVLSSAVAIVAFAGLGLSSTSGSDDAIRAEIDEIVSRQIAQRNLPGVSVAVVKDGVVFYAQGYGYANLEHRVPATAETVYLIGSVTKPFTAMAILLLADEGLLSVDDAIGDHLDDIPDSWKAVTITQLLNHTSGIKSYTGLSETWRRQREDVNPSQILEMAGAQDSDFEPGARWMYNNTAYVLLGVLIEELSGSSYAEFIDERILSELGLTSTGYNSWREVIPARASGYSRTQTGVLNAEYLSPSWPYSAGSIYSTANDLAEWVIALDSKSLLSEKAYELMYGTVVSVETGQELAEIGPEPGYGLGWAVMTIGEKLSIGHGGGINGFNSDVRRVPEDGFAVIVLVNTDGGAGFISGEIFELFYPESAQASFQEVDDPDPEVTEMIKRFMEGLIAGSPDRSKLTTEFNEALTDEMVATVASALGEEEMGEFKLIGVQTLEGGLVVRRYAIQFGDAAVILIAAVDDDGKIAGLQLAPA